MEENVARAIHEHIAAIGGLMSELPGKTNLMFTASIIQHSDGDFVSFDLVDRGGGESVFRYHNVTIDKNTNTVVRASDFVTENLKQ